MYSMSCISSSSKWSRMDDKLFERALVLFPDDTPDKWEKIARHVPGKSWSEVKQHYEDLVHDLVEIDSGRVGLPCYGDEFEFDSSRLGGSGELGMVQLSFLTKGKERESERRKGIPWTEEEHRLFLIGLQRYGKGDWRSISRNAVVSRTPTQVASHAQKYFLRLNSVKKDKKRCSIHDITGVTAANLSAQISQENCVMDDPSADDPPESSNFFQHQGSSSYQQIGFPM